MPSVSLPTAALIAGGVGAAGSVASAVIGGNAAQSAAQTQATAAQQAEQQQLAEFNQTQANVQPYITAGTGALSEAQNLLGLTGPGGTAPAGGPNTAAIQATLAATPGYQFTLQQGEEATQNGYAAQGLGSSGAALKGAATFATGLADQTYEQQLNNYLGLAGTGANAALALGGQGVQATNIAGNYGTSGAASTAAGTVGSANALTSGITGVGNNISSAALLTSLNSAGIFGNPSSNPLVINAPAAGNTQTQYAIGGTALSPGATP